MATPAHIASPRGLAVVRVRIEIRETLRPFGSFVFSALLLVGTPSRAAPEAEARHRLEWRSEWRRFEWIDGVQTGMTTAAYLYVQFGIEPREEPRWTGPILFDAGVRDALVADSRDGRNRAAVISDVLWYLPMAYPFVDSIVVPLAFDDWNWDIAWELTAMNVQAASVDALLTRFGHHVILRERPDTEPCERDPEYDDTCFGGPNASFPGGHASAALLGAGLACAHHSELPLYGGGFLDAAVCATLLTTGLAGAVTRVIADRHYATDSIAGVVIGLGTGFGMPVLLHYHGVGSFDEGSARTALRWTVVPMAQADALGLGAFGWF